uniref:Uncharacterized protein n=1 Tax=Tetraselmis sp. GSL018 TaxID=582737 RepID=A0A061RL22_9CHLO
MIRVRLLIATLFIPQSRIPELRDALEELAKAASTEDDEWIRVFGLAVGKFDGRLDIREVMREFPLVENTVHQLMQQLEHIDEEPGFRPLEEVYLSHRLKRLRGLSPQQELPPANPHFRLREGARLSLAQMLDEQEGAHPAASAEPAAASAQGAAAAGAQPSEPEADMFMDANPVKESVTIAGLGTVGRVDTRRGGGRMKQLDVDEAIAAEELSRQMMEAGSAQERTPKAQRVSYAGDDYGSPSADAGTQNPFSGAFGQGGDQPMEEDAPQEMGGANLPSAPFGQAASLEGGPNPFSFSSEAPLDVGTAADDQSLGYSGGLPEAQGESELDKTD